MPRKPTVPEAAPKGAAPSPAPSIDHAVLANFVRKIGKKLGEDEVALYDPVDPRFRVPYWISTGAPDLDQKLGGGVAGGRVIEIFSKNESEGKCEKFGTPVLMADGSIKAVEDVNLGDLVMGGDGTPRRVLEKHLGEGPLFLCSERNGKPYSVTGNHRLAVSVPLRGKGEFVTALVRADELSGKTFDLYGVKAGRVEFLGSDSRVLPVEPYYVGLWLGDGTTSKQNEVTSADPEVEEYLRGYAARLGMKCNVIRDPRTKALRMSITGGLGARVNPLVRAMVGLGFDGSQKFIPDAYRRSSSSARLALLAGYIDADGHLQGGRQYQITSKLLGLAEDIVWVARSLGLRCGEPSKFTGRIKRAGKDFEASYYKFYVSGDALGDVPVLLPRKRGGDHVFKRYVGQHSGGLSVRPDGFGKWCGLTVDGDHLFCLGDFTVTHNSSVAATIARECQRLGGAVVWYDSEHTILPDYFKDFGLDVADLTFFYNPNLEGFFSAVEEFATGFREIFPTAPLLFVLDSVAATQTVSQEEADYEKAGVAAQARVMSSSLRKLVPHLSKTQSTLLLVNQSRTKIGVMYGDDNDTPGGRAMKFYASQRIALRKVAKPLTDEKDRLIGIDVEAHIVKNKVAPPFKKSGFRLLFGRGISYTESAFDLLVRREVILGGAAGRYTFPGVVEGSFFKKEFPDILAANPHIRDEVTRQVHIPELSFGVEVDPTLIEDDSTPPAE